MEPTGRVDAADPHRELLHRYRTDRSIGEAEATLVAQSDQHDRGHQDDRSRGQSGQAGTPGTHACDRAQCADLAAIDLVEPVAQVLGGIEGPYLLGLVATGQNVLQGTAVRD